MPAPMQTLFKATVLIDGNTDSGRLAVVKGKQIVIRTICGLNSRVIIG